MKKCEACIWFEQCACEEACGYYSPAETDIDTYIEEEREEFRREWAAYACGMEG